MVGAEFSLCNFFYSTPTNVGGTYNEHCQPLRASSRF